MNKIAIILGGGVGLRAGGNVPKQFRILGNHPVAWWSLRAFYDEDKDVRIIAVIHPKWIEEWKHLMSSLPQTDKIPHEICYGGLSRWQSVKNALDFVGNCEGTIIAVHDAARPLVTPELIRRGWECAMSLKVGVPVINLSCSLRHIRKSSESVAVDRSEFMEVQTPQMFDGIVISDSYSNPEQSIFTDDASVVEASGYKVALYNGDPYNIKITNPLDIHLAETILVHRL